MKRGWWYYEGSEDGRMKGGRTVGWREGGRWDKGRDGSRIKGREGGRMKGREDGRMKEGVMVG
jgi:hypothetical protein